MKKEGFRRGQYPVPPSPFLRDGSIAFAAASRSASGRLFRKEKNAVEL